MGRPINKNNLGDVSGAIQVTSYRRSTGAEVTGQDDTYIASQRSTNKFLIGDTSGAWTEVMTLVDTAQGALANGEFIIHAVDDAGLIQRVTRLYNRTLRLSNGSRMPWGFATEGVITAATQAVGMVITSAAHGLSVNDVVSINNVAGMTELNANTAFTITAVTVNTFTIGAVDSTGYGVYTSGGFWTLAPDTGSAVIDKQAS